MARSYDILAEFGIKGKDADQLTLNPFVVLAFYRYRYPVTFSRRDGQSFRNYLPNATELRGEPLVIVNDIFQLQVQNSKSNHVTQMSCSLYPGLNYLTEVLPGDYVYAWMVQDQETLDGLIKKLGNGDPCNGFYDGLKFFGKVAGVRKRIQQSPQGPRSSVYSINAAGFTELDASIYFEPYLQAKSVGLGTELFRSNGTKLNKIIADNGQGIAINKVIPIFFDTFFGKGVPKNSGFQGGPSTTAGLDNPNAFVVPGAVAKTLGITEGTKPHGLISFTDIMEFIHGVQKYSTDISLSEDNIAELRQLHNTKIGDPTFNSEAAAANILLPDNLSSTGRIRFTGINQLGTFLPQVPHFTGQKTVWSILTQFLNPTVNEIYTCLKVNPDGVVMPTVVLRQLPFSSGILSDTYRARNPLTANGVKQTQKQKEQLEAYLKPKHLELTRFTELPRWLIHPIFIKEADVGRSDTLRFNFVHVQGETGLPSNNKTGQLIRDPPIKDELDISRSGLRPYMATVNCSQQDTNNHRAGEWMYIISDILMGQHLTLTGTLSCYGIQAPIAVGDNIEFDETIFHIESMSHQFNISPNGQKSFTTALALSHGVSAKQSDGGDLSLYSGLHSSDLTHYDAEHLAEYEYKQPEPTEPGDGKTLQDRDAAADIEAKDTSNTPAPVLKGEGGPDFF